MPRSRYSSGPSTATVIIGIILVLAIVVAIPTALILSRDNVTFTVSEKIVKRKAEGGDQYLVYTNRGVYTNKDSWLALKFNSSDIYGQLKVGKTFDCKVQGWRIPLFSKYKNILECDEV